MTKKDLTPRKFYLIFFLSYCDCRIFLNFVLRSLSDRPKTENAVVAQLVEHRLPKPRVTGSSPAYRSNKANSPDVSTGLFVLLIVDEGSQPVTLHSPFRGWGCQYKSRTARACTSFESRLPLRFRRATVKTVVRFFCRCAF